MVIQMDNLYKTEYEYFYEVGLIDSLDKVVRLTLQGYDGSKVVSLR